ncbi:MGH1-like glycoside hydrolase domain-containing protein [Mucilaginibacter boryungensis]|uniref:Glycoside hydrolase family 37 n=1 Tax=Mucilaginibacter boryungensis TaxID=768480 RepID=A0ABR9XJ32_9SPHI|nr:trehalase family glycosidase [Mucilaginibacter boryungensis]MBE9667379.1 glycoside hydrolase family 37 [Mucilaginibacter boryungensis]
MKKITFVLALILSAVAGFAQIPDSIADRIKIIKKYVFEDYKQMLKQPTGALLYPYITPGSKSYAAVLWDWDSWLSNIALRQILQDRGTAADKREAVAYEQGCVLNYLAYTGADGYMPMVVDRDADPAKIKPADIYSTNMHKPVIAQHAAFLSKLNDGNAEWLREKFSLMQAFIKNYQTHHRNEDTGLFFWQDDLAIGVDNDPSTFFRPKRSSASIYLNCLMYKELQAMAYLAECLKLKEASLQYDRDAAALKAAIQKNCWDEKDGFYYSVDLNLRPITNEPSIVFGKPFVLHKGMPRTYAGLIQRFGVWSGFMAMWAGIATPEQAKRMVAENYLDKRTFNARYGIRTLSKLEKMYSLKASSNPSNWLGPIWGISNYLTYRGLLKYGYKKEATGLAYKTIMLFGNDFKKEGALHEYYDPDTGAPIMNKGFQNWNYLVLNMIDQLTGHITIEEF